MLNRNDLANAITDYSHTLTSKALAVVGGTSAISHTRFGDWIADTVIWFKTWPWMETLSYIAIILLLIERGFICWAWYRRYKRGEL
jgi:hypothetical protein